MILFSREKIIEFQSIPGNKANVYNHTLSNMNDKYVTAFKKQFEFHKANHVSPKKWLSNRNKNMCIYIMSKPAMLFTG